MLKVLNLNGNKLKKLDSNTFRGMRFLRRLHLRNNRIDDVGRATFGSMARIGTIDLGQNYVKKIDYQMFSQLQFAEVYSQFEKIILNNLIFLIMIILKIFR